MFAKQPVKMSKSLYHRLANEALSGLSEQLEQMPYGGDMDYQEGNLQYSVKGIGEYVFNKQPPAMQIWASSPITGPAKFSVDRKHGWIESKRNIPFSSYVEEELKKIQDKLKLEDINANG